MFNQDRVQTFQMKPSIIKTEIDSVSYATPLNHIFSLLSGHNIIMLVSIEKNVCVWDLFIHIL